ncbi:hypothetical protein [Acinetobacter sp.]|uniref:hypothetical protein n=1 Tax=Acinetobacter sp. TaxID=472 RepID=UPI0035AF597C
MKKLLILLLIFSALWIVKISFDLYRLSAGQEALGQQQKALEQRNASLNDQLAALNRQLSSPAAPANAQDAPLAQPAGALQPAALIGQQLDLVEFALRQQQYSLALEKLNQLNQNLELYALAPALKASLHQAVSKDRQMVMQFVNANAEQQNKLSAVLNQLDQGIAQELKAQYAQPAPQPERSFWQRWIQVESAQQPSPLLMQRSIILKEAQLRLLLAQQQLHKGQYIAFQQELTEAVHILKPLPDAKAKYFVQRLNELKKIPALTAPILNTRALIG